MKYASTSRAGAMFNPFLPVVLFGLAVALAVGLQLKGEITRRSALMTAIKQREQIAKQGDAVRAKLDRFASGLYHTAESDATARALVQKYRIQIAQKPEKPAEEE